MPNKNPPLSKTTFTSKHLIEALFFCRDRVEDYFDNSSDAHQVMTVMEVAQLFGVPAALQAFTKGSWCHPKAGVVICRAIDFMAKKLTDVNPEVTKAALCDESQLRSLMASNTANAQTVTIYALLMLATEAHAIGQWRRSLRYVVMSYADAQVLETYGRTVIYKKEDAIREIFDTSGAAP